jgi:hypothetical protein
MAARSGCRDIWKLNNKAIIFDINCLSVAPAVISTMQMHNFAVSVENLLGVQARKLQAYKWQPQ